jgi:aspartate/methionine/tyrosine aminotransferase
MEVLERAWELERQGRSVIRLCVGEPDLGTPAPVVEAAGRATASGEVHYAPSLGLPELREAIAASYQDRFGVAVPARRVVVTTGASGALLLALAATVDPGDELLLADPGYPCNRHFLRVFEGVTRPVPVDADTRYQLTADLVASSWGPRTRGLVLATPSNPTGTRVAPDELGRILDVTRRRSGLAMVDEIYGELVYDAPPATALAHGDDMVVLNSFSKTFGMTGWRLGWMVCPDGLLEAVEALTQNLFIAAPTPAQWGALACFTEEVWDEVARRRDQFRQRRDVLVEGLRSLGFGVPVTPDGAFYVYADCSPFATDSADFARRLLDGTGVAVTPGNDFGAHRADRHVRFSVTRPVDQIVEALDRLATFVRS